MLCFFWIGSEVTVILTSLPSGPKLKFCYILQWNTLHKFYILIVFKRTFGADNQMPAQIVLQRAPRRTGMKRKRQSSASSRRTRQRTTYKKMNARTGGFLGIETKFIDYEYNALVQQSLVGSLAVPATALALNAVAQGDGESDRDGRKCTTTALHMRGYVQIDKNATGVDPLTASVRIVVVHDTQTNGGQLTETTVFKDPTGTALEPLVFRNLQYAKRFRILMDKSISLYHPSGGGSTMPVYAPARKHFTLNKTLNMPTIYKSNGAIIGNITDNSIQVLAFSGATDSPCTLRYISRVRFVG